MNSGRIDCELIPVAVLSVLAFVLAIGGLVIVPIVAILSRAGCS